MGKEGRVMTPAAVESLAFVEWQGQSTYVTARGKAKDIVTGIPSPMFWRRWKHRGGSGRVYNDELETEGDQNNRP
jgi:hypothetical protein